MKIYELTYIVSSDSTVEKTEEVAKEIDAFIQENEGTIIKRESPVAKNFSYSVKGKDSGFLNVLDFQLEPEKLIGLKEKIEKEAKIIRYLLLIKKPGRKIKIRNKGKKFEFTPESGAFNSPFSQEKSGDKEAVKDNLDDKKLAEDKSEKFELKDIEKKLDEILGE